VTYDDIYFVVFVVLFWMTDSPWTVHEGLWDLFRNICSMVFSLNYNFTTRCLGYWYL